MKNTSNCYNKHLDLSKRIKIEKGIEEKRSFSDIASDINKSPRTISYEILRNRNVEYCSSWVSKFKICEKTSKPPYVCNACPSRKDCRKTRYYYYAEDAQGKYKKIRSDSRKGIDMTSTEFKYLNDTVSTEIRNGHSFAMIIRNHKDEFPVGKRTLYNYVEKGYLDIINLDLPRKVRYKKENTTITKIFLRKILKSELIALMKILEILSKILTTMILKITLLKWILLREPKVILYYLLYYGETLTLCLLKS